MKLKISITFKLLYFSRKLEVIPWVSWGKDKSPLKNYPHTKNNIIKYQMYSRFQLLTAHFIPRSIFTLLNNAHTSCCYIWSVFGLFVWLLVRISVTERTNCLIWKRLKHSLVIKFWFIDLFFP